MKKMKIGIIGCGNISSIYLQNCSQVFRNVEIAACADLILERAQAKAQEYNIPIACTVEELLANPDIDIVLNITIPKAHAQVSLQALEAGKHVYVEKPLAVTLQDGEKILAKAAEKGLRVGGAPDTFLGGGLQTCKKLIEDGWIGTPIGATAFMTCHGHESWHPDPEFYYKTGGGPMFDMGPYYLTALVSLLGPAARVAGSARVTFPERTITSAPKYGEVIQVDVPTHVAGLVEFQNGAVANIITSFDIWAAQLPYIEIYGTDGTLKVPDPNGFGGPVYIRRKESGQWVEMPLAFDFSDNSRGIGLADMAGAIAAGRKHRASGELMYHVLEIMHGFHISSYTGIYYSLQSSCEKPQLFALNKAKDQVYL